MEDSSDVSKVQVKYQADMMVHYQIYYKAKKEDSTKRAEFLSTELFVLSRPVSSCTIEQSF